MSSHLLLALLLSAASGDAAPPASASVREPPAAHCLDARRIEAFHQSDARTLLLRDGDGARLQVSLQEDCPGLQDDGGLRILAPGGWLCGAPGERLRTDARSCAVDAVSPLDAAAWSDLLRSDGIATLDPVQASHRRAHGFRGTADHCVSIHALRGWRDGPEGLSVEVSPRRAGGNRHYRIETMGGCADQTNAETLQLHSGMDLGMVCGHPGDRVVFARAQPLRITDEDKPFARPVMQSRLAQEHGCRIVRVYPIEG